MDKKFSPSLSRHFIFNQFTIRRSGSEPSPFLIKLMPLRIQRGRARQVVGVGRVGAFTRQVAERRI